MKKINEISVTNKIRDAITVLNFKYNDLKEFDANIDKEEFFDLKSEVTKILNTAISEIENSTL